MLSTVKDYWRFSQMILNGGEFEGKRLLSPSLVREMQVPRVHAGGSEFAEFGDSHYGLGFGCYHYRGERAVSHSGGWVGWSTLMTLLPDRNCACVAPISRRYAA